MFYFKTILLDFKQGQNKQEKKEEMWWINFDYINTELFFKIFRILLIIITEIIFTLGFLM
jgi:hypothetical protein